MNETDLDMSEKAKLSAGDLMLPSLEVTDVPLPTPRGRRRGRVDDGDLDRRCCRSAGVKTVSENSGDE